jgi:hypothetical protein
MMQPTDDQLAALDAVVARRIAESLHAFREMLIEDAAGPEELEAELKWARAEMETSWAVTRAELASWVLTQDDVLLQGGHHTTVQ